MDMPNLCPVCGIGLFEPMFISYRAQTIFYGEVHPLGGSLQPNWCANSHVFMLLDTESLKVAADSTTMLIH
jgi:hypothetical protein